jgi:hypothetical protein
MRRNMGRRRRDRPARRLRVSIDALPRATKLAMLEGARSGPIITGAYTSDEGTCPMLAAHRRGGRTSLDTFARAWDGYTRAAHGRLATERELRALEAMLEASLGAEEGPSAGDLGRAIAAHREHAARTGGREGAPEGLEQRAPSADAEPLRPGDPDRSAELRARWGWAWLRVFRRYDDYRAALAELEGAAPVDAPGERDTHAPGPGAAREPAPGATAPRARA